MNSIELCDAGALQPFIRCMQRRGIDADRYLASQRIPPAQVAAGEGKIIKRQAWRLFHEVQRKEGLDTLGFLDGDPFCIDDLGELGSILRQSPTLNDAIETFARLIPSFAEGNTVRLIRGPEISWLYCHTDGLDPEARVPDHFTIVVLCAVIRLAAGPDWRPEKVHFQSAATPAPERAPLVGDLESRFNQAGSAIAFRTALLAKPVAKVENPIPRNLPSPQTGSPCRSLSETLRLFLSSRIIHHRLPTSAEAAEILGVSRSTLSRTLVGEGSSYRRTIERIRFESARELLKENHSIKEIAHGLGYSGPNNFIRAFKRINGTTPAEFRRLQ